MGAPSREGEVLAGELVRLPSVKDPTISDARGAVVLHTARWRGGQLDRGQSPCGGESHHLDASPCRRTLHPGTGERAAESSRSSIGSVDRCGQQIRQAHTTNRYGYTMHPVPASHVMTVSRNGQVSIPASARTRWRARKVLVVDLGDRVVVRPLPDEPIAALRGKYRGRGPATDTVRRQERAADSVRERRR